MNGSSDSRSGVSDSTTTSATATVSETRKIGSTGSPGSPGVLHVIDKSRNHKSKVDRFRGSCWWTRYCPDYSKWVTDCGHEFTAGGADPEDAGPLKPIDAGFEFCCFCGRELVQDYFEPKDEEEVNEDEDVTDTYADCPTDPDAPDDSGVPDDVQRVVMSTAEWINDHAAPQPHETPETPESPSEPDVPEKWTVKREDQGYVVGGPYQNVAIPDPSQPQTLKKTYSSLFQVDLPQSQTPATPGNPPGLTLRDYFAAEALKHLMVTTNLHDNAHAVTNAWSVADMMMAQRERDSEYQKWMEHQAGIEDRRTFQSPWVMELHDVNGEYKEVDIWEKYSWDWKERVKVESGMGEIEFAAKLRPHGVLKDFG